MTAPLKLIAQDSEDLQVLSVHLQDAIGRVADTGFDPRGRRFALAMSRFRWEDQAARPAPPLRQRTVVLIEGAVRVRSRQLNRNDPESVLALLAITFTPATGDPGPAGTLTLAFAGGAEIALDVEAIDVSLRDEGAPWIAQSTPRHG